jgi:hypothetical protein
VKRVEALVEGGGGGVLFLLRWCCH